MNTPMRVEWTVPDEAKRAAAREALNRDLQDWNSDIKIAICRARDASEKFEIAAKRFPDLDAVIVHYGTLLSVRYVPEQWGLRTFQRGGIDLGTTGAQPVKLCESKWVALVATEDGTREMDPRDLRVMWPMSASDPIGGVVSWDELERRKGSRAEHAMAVVDWAQRHADHH